MTNWITWLDETILKSKPSSPEVGVGARSYLLNDLLHHAKPRLVQDVAAGVNLLVKTLGSQGNYYRDFY